MVNNTWILIYKKLSNTASPQELKELEQILQEDAGAKYPIAMLEYLWRSLPKSVDKVDEPTEEKWAHLQAQLNQMPDVPLAEESQASGSSNKVINGKSRFFKYGILIAATLLVFGSMTLIVLRSSDAKNGVNEIAVPRGGMTNIQLPDGSTVILNAGSKITYKNSFDSQHRELTLSGEAFFDVVKDPSHPFIVTTKTIKIRVLGTRFNVRSYPGDKTSEASLLRGIIELTVLKNPDRQFILKPSEKMTIINPLTIRTASIRHVEAEAAQNPIVELSQIHQTSADSLPAEAIWIKNKIVFDGLDFEEIARMMERKYNVAIVFKKDSFKSMKLTGKFENIPLDRALKQLQLIANFKYQINANQVFIF